MLWSLTCVVSISSRSSAVDGVSFWPYGVGTSMSPPSSPTASPPPRARAPPRRARQRPPCSPAVTDSPPYPRLSYQQQASGSDSPSPLLSVEEPRRPPSSAPSSLPFGGSASTPG